MASLTVLMPVYNSEKYLAAAIDSILGQSFRDFEFLIIDDGSTDSSLDIIKSYQDPRIRLYQNEKNLGISATLNRGIALANTAFIARMDADDISYPERLYRQYTYLQAHPDCAMVSSLARVVTEDGETVRVDKIKGEHIFYNLTFICWIYHSTVMYRTDAVKRVNMYTVAYSEDFELFWQLSRRYRIHQLDEVLLDYRQTGQSLHQVMKRKEYEESQQAQVLRNIRYYAGSNYNIPQSYLACYRHSFNLIPARLAPAAVISCIKELDFITQCILKDANPNAQATAIKTAARYKREFIIRNLLRDQPSFYRVYVWYRLKSITSLARELKQYVRQMLLPPQDATN